MSLSDDARSIARLNYAKAERERIRAEVCAVWQQAARESWTAERLIGEILKRIDEVKP